MTVLPVDPFAMVDRHGYGERPRHTALQRSATNSPGSMQMGPRVTPSIKTFADGHPPPDQVVPGML